MAELLRALLDRPPQPARPPAARGRRPEIHHDQGQHDQKQGRRQMNHLAAPDAFGVITEDATLTIQRLLPGPIERVWAYLTESDLRRQWMASGDMELKVGAPFELTWRNNELSNPPGKRPEGFGDEH